MQYAQGRIGRVFAARLEDGEPVYDAIQELAGREDVACALVLLLGGARSATVVTGPRNVTGPIEPRLQSFDDAREMIAVGTLYPSDNGPALHLHAGFGRDDVALIGCPRYALNTYLVAELVVIEIEGLDAARRLDPESGLKLLRFASAQSVDLGPCG